MFRTLLHAGAAIAALSLAAHFVAPGKAAQAGDWLYRNIAGWSSDACTAAPAECFKAKERELAAVRDDLSRVQERLDTEIARSGSILTDNRRLLSQNAVLLEEGRRVHQSPVPGPVVYGGVSYPNKEALAAQLELLFAEKKQLEQVVGDAERLQNELSLQRRSVTSRRSEVDAALRSMPAKVALIQARQMLGRLDEDLRLIDGVIASGREQRSKASNLLRSTEEIGRDLAASNRPSPDAAFRAWLDGAG